MRVVADVTHCGLVASQIFVNIGSGNGLVPDGTKPSPGLMLTCGRLEAKLSEI